MGMLVGVAAQVPLPLDIEHGREPRVVAPGHAPHHRVGRWRPGAEQGVHRVACQTRVPGKPKLRAGLADRRHQNVERALRDGRSLLDPGDVDALHGLDRLGMGGEPGKQEKRAFRSLDVGFGRLEAPHEAECLDTIVDQALGRVTNGALKLSCAQNAQGRLGSKQHQCGGHGVRLAGATPAEERLVAGRSKQIAKSSRQLDITVARSA